MRRVRFQTGDGAIHDGVVATHNGRLCVESTQSSRAFSEDKQTLALDELAVLVRPSARSGRFEIDLPATVTVYQDAPLA